MRPGSRLLRKPASCDQSCRSTSAISTAERTGASNRSPAHTQGPIAQAASAQKMFLTRSATDVLQGLPACRQHCPHSAKISAPSFNPASVRSRSRLQSGPRRVARPHRTLQILRGIISDSDSMLGTGTSMDDGDDYRIWSGSHRLDPASPVFSAVASKRNGRAIHEN